MSSKREQQAASRLASLPALPRAPVNAANARGSARRYSDAELARLPASRRGFAVTSCYIFRARHLCRPQSPTRNGASSG
jgi:hypothetical protein